MIDHPVIVALRDTTRIRPDDLDYIIEHGRNYRGTSLPTGVRRWPLGECLNGTEDMVDRGLGRSVTGFVLRPGDRKPMPHYWVEQGDGLALDPTLQDPKSSTYWGLGRSHRDRVSRIVAHAFRGSTSAGLPVELMRGGLVGHQFKPFRMRLW